MKRATSSRAASPTPTAHSGFSNYRNESYRPLKDRNVPQMPPIDYRQVSRVHFAELSEYLAEYLARSPPNSRTSARQKLTRLTVQQFHELSTDVYDELVRRKLDNAPFLPVRDDFHPKRNQARQKLATLPTTRFEDLSSDVYFELARRYPEFKEDPQGGPSSPYDEYPRQQQQQGYGSSRLSNRSDDRNPPDSGYGGSFSTRRSGDRRRPSEDISTGRRSEDDGGYSSSRRKPSQDTSRSAERVPSRHDRNESSSTARDLPNNNANAARSDVIIPAKSTIETEYIQVPYGREIPDDPEPEVPMTAGYSEPPDTASDYPMSPTSPAARGLNGLSSRLRQSDDEDDRPPPPRKNYYGRSSQASDLSSPGVQRNGSSSGATNQEVERVKKDYELQIANMQSEISDLKRDLGEAEDRGRRAGESSSKVKQLTDELANMRRRAEEHSNEMKGLQRELDDVRETRLREQDREARRQREDEDEMETLRDRIRQLQDEQSNAPIASGADPDVVNQLRSDMESLLGELSDLSQRNDELESIRESDRIAMREIELQAKEWKRKYEQAKTELRSMKATSQLFSQQPRMDAEDQLPVSPDGGLVDIHVTSFLSSIDSLLTAARGNSPGKVLSPMKGVVNAVSALIDDLTAFEKRPSRDRQDVDVDALHALRERAEATLSNLVVASKTHATSSGMSPVSLLDAAASHVSSCVTEMGRTVAIRKATRSEQDQFSSSAQATPRSPVNGFTSPLKAIDERATSPLHARNASQASSRSAPRSNGANSSPRYQASASRRPPGPPSDNSSERTNSPPAIFDQPNGGGGVTSDESVGGGDWAEVKPYLEAQTESIVFAIQSVLSDVRSTAPSPKLNENLTQIITIVASVVAVCSDGLPPSSAAQGNEILRELSDHADRLSEVQNTTGNGLMSKESRQVIAKSSFAIANGMKALVKL